MNNVVRPLTLQSSPLLSVLISYPNSNQGGESTFLIPVMTLPPSTRSYDAPTVEFPLEVIYTSLLEAEIED